MGTSKSKAMVRSLLFSYVLTGILLLAVAFALYRLRLGEGQVTLAVYSIYVISCFLGAMVIGKILKQNRFFWGLLLGLSYFVILFVVSLLMNKGLAGNVSQIAAVMGTCIASGCAGGMLS